MSQRKPSSSFVRAASRWLIAAIVASVFVCGLLWHSTSLLGVGAALVCLMLRRVGTEAAAADDDNEQSGGRRRAHRHSRSEGNDAEELQQLSEQFASTAERMPAPGSADALVDELLADGRYALLLQPEMKQHLTQTQVLRAIRQLDEAMALVPAGHVLIGQLAELSNSACGQGDIDPKLVLRNMAEVATVYLDRFCVTNADYQRFVDAGGYEQLE